MAKELITKEQLFNKMKKLSSNNVLKISKKKLAQEVGFVSAGSNSFAKHLIELENEGSIKLIEKAKNLGKGNWTENVWEIGISNNTMLVEQKVKYDYFKGIKLRLINHNNKWNIPLNDVCDGVGIDRVAARQMIDRNIELFKDFVSNCIIQSPAKSHQETIVLNKEGIIGLLMKISYTRLPDSKKKLVLEFQKWAIEKLSQLISDGKVELNEKEHVKVQQDVGYITGMTEEQIDKMFNEIDDYMNKLFTTAKSTIKILQNDKNKSEYEKEMLKKENQKWINHTLVLKEKLLNLNIV